MAKENLTIKDCYFLYEKYKAPNVVIKHSESVAKVAYVIAKKLMESGKKIDLKNTVYAALLHDIFKIIEVSDYSKHTTPMEVEAKKVVWDNLREKFKGKDHEEAFFEEFSAKHPKMALFGVGHKYSRINDGFSRYEEKIIYYADKLVMFDKITTLNERLNDAKKRYSNAHTNSPAHKKFIDETNYKIELLEKEIFKDTGLSMEYLIKLNSIDFKKLVSEDFNGEI